MSAFQRQMEAILEGPSNSKVYLDDIMTHSKSFDDHLIHLELVFKRFKNANLKIKASKCLFAARETKFLGFDVLGFDLTFLASLASVIGIQPTCDLTQSHQSY